MISKPLLRHARKVAFLYDTLMVPCAWLLAYLFRFNFSEITSEIFIQAYVFFPIIFSVQLICFYYFGLYRGMWRFASMSDLLRIIKSIFSAVLIAGIIGFAFNRLNAIPRTIFPLYALSLLCALGGARLFVRWFKSYNRVILTAKKNVLMLGIDPLSESFIRETQRGNIQNLYMSGIISLDGTHMGREIHGVRVLGCINSIATLVNKLAIDLIVISEGEHTTELNNAIDIIKTLQKPVRLLPKLDEVISGKFKISDLQEIKIESLLGRTPVFIEESQISSQIQAKCILVSGGAGSIGAELVEQIVQLKPRKVIILDNAEYHLYEILQRLSNQNVVGCLADVKDQITLKSILTEHKPDIIFHAAAFKHVPLLETHKREAVNNNILGTYNLAKLAIEYNVEKFVLVSTDKAVRPTNIMGATKRVAEILCQALNVQAKTKFITVRFGNVLGSRGSVVPLFKSQIEKFGPVTVTHPDITRYFMTIPEACNLILQAGAMGEGSEIYVLDMGKPIKIVDLAEQMIRLSGKEPYKEVDIKFTGLRPGEKLEEELFYKDEPLIETRHQKIFKSMCKEEKVKIILKNLVLFQEAVSNNNVDQMLDLLYAFVPELQTHHQQRRSQSETLANYG